MKESKSKEQGMEASTGMEAYSGTWGSSKHPKAFSRGNVIIHLPKNRNFTEEKKDETTGNPLTVEAQIEYLGLYRLRQKEKIQITLQGTKAVTENHKSQGYENNPGGVGNLQFFVEKQMNNEIQGRYILTNPADHGTFHMKKGDNHTQNCLIQ